MPLKSSSRVRLHTRARATYDRAYLVWYAKEGSIAETSVKTILKSVDFTIFKLTEYMLSTQIKLIQRNFKQSFQKLSDDTFGLQG